MSLWSRNTAIAALTGLIFSAGCAAGSEEDTVLNSQRQAVVDTINGLKTINGLRTLNGLKTINGLDVDCTGKTAGVNCTGEPDGLLDNNTGLMSTPDGVTTASYLVRCALASGDSIRIKDYSGALVTLAGEAGLSSGWKDGQCDGPCQEKISACLMALTNGDGVHVDVELVAPFTLGSTHAYPYQEAAFYGNIFVDPPQAFYCVGKDYAENGIHITLLEERSCTGYNETNGTCPYKRAGYCNNAISLSLSDDTLSGDNKCSWTGASLLKKDVASSCKDSSGGVGGGLSLLSSGKSWSYPITTYRKVKQ